MVRYTLKVKSLRGKDPRYLYRDPATNQIKLSVRKKLITSDDVVYISRIMRSARVHYEFDTHFIGD